MSEIKRRERYPITVLSEISAEALSAFPPADLRRLLKKGVKFGEAVNFFARFFPTLLILYANTGNRSPGISTQSM